MLTIVTFAAVLTIWHWRVGSPPGLAWTNLGDAFRLPFLPPQPSAAKAPEPNVPGTGQPKQNQPQQPQQPQQLQDALLIDNGGSLDTFYAGLAQLDSHVPQATATVIHFGDSPTTADLITGDVREQLQQRFGDAGQGFNLIAKPWAWYGHRNIDESDHGWKWTTAVGFMKEGHYGIGGAVFDGGAGAGSSFSLNGAPQSTAEFLFASQADGGTFTVAADGKQIAAIDTSKPDPDASPAPAYGLAFKTVNLPQGTRKLELQVVSGTVRLYGVLFGRSQPGLLYDSLGLNGASTTVLSRAMPVETMKQSFAHLRPNLIVINYGTNEAGFASFVDTQYEGELRAAIARIRAAAPNASILVMSPMDRGERGAGNSISTMATIPRLVAIQQRVAGETGCAFFNTFQAMGGDGTMQRWYTSKPRLVGGDLIHPSPAGARIVADALVAELEKGYGRYQARSQPAPGSASHAGVPVAAEWPASKPSAKLEVSASKAAASQQTQEANPH
jgi:lysophospholipase L1-like esterase